MAKPWLGLNVMVDVTLTTSRLNLHHKWSHFKCTLVSRDLVHQVSQRSPFLKTSSELKYLPTRCLPHTGIIWSMMNIPTQTASGGKYAPLSNCEAATTVLADDNFATPSSSAIIPELETYLWQDTYFDAEYSSQEIIAVFDHDLKAIARDRHCSLFTAFVIIVYFSFMCAGLVAGPLGALFILVGAMASFALSRKLSRIATPHTAVTRQGVLHVEGGNYWGGGEEVYFIPWSGIEEFIVTAVSYLKLVDMLESYLLQQPEFDSQYRQRVLALGSLKKPCLFQKLVLALKSGSSDQLLSDLRQDELTFETSMMEMVAQTAAASNGSSDQILAAIHEELKRRNDILKSALESESCKTCDAPRIPVAVAYPDGTYS